MAYTKEQMGTHDEPATLPCPSCRNTATSAGTAGKGLGSIFQCGRCGFRFFPATYAAKITAFHAQIAAEQAAWREKRERGDD